MKHVFVRLQEEGIETNTCLLLSGDRAEEFINDQEGFVEDFSPDATLLDSWEVPEELKDIVVGNEVSDAFEALLELNLLNDTPIVSDIFATIFEAGYRLAKKES